MGAYYKYSGKFAPQGVILGLLVGMAASIPFTFLYVYGIVSIPEAKLRGICTVAFGALIGALSGMAMSWGKVRNNFVAASVGFIASLFGLYASWFAWILHLIHPAQWMFNLSRPMTHPDRLWQAMLAVNETGTWSTGGTPEHGTILWIVWIAEALLIVGTGTFVAVTVMHLRPFCERCEQWCSQKTKLYFAPSIAAGEFKARLESQNVSALDKLSVGNAKQPHFRVDLQSCGNCHSLNTLTLVQNFPKDRKTIANKLLVTPEQAAAVRNLALARSARTS